MVNKLIDFGHSFQIKMIVSLMTNLTYLEQIQDILDEKHFDNDGMKWIIKECKDYYQKYKEEIARNSPFNIRLFNAPLPK